MHPIFYHYNIQGLCACTFIYTVYINGIYYNLVIQQSRRSINKKGLKEISAKKNIHLIRTE